MKIKFFLFILILCHIQVVLAQQFTLKGTVIDEDEQPIEFATVACASQGKMTATNLKGEFSIQLQSADSVTVRFSMIGYNAKQRVFKRPRGTLHIKIVLPSMHALDEVVITEKRRQTTTTEKLDIKDIQGTPTTSGNAIEELIQQQAGVSTHNEFSSQYNVRGGNFDENSVYLNDIEVYRPLLIRSGQQEGLSVINSDMVNDVRFSAGGFEAKYGDKMSSVLDITYKKPTQFEATANVSLMGGSAYIGYGTKKFSMSHGIRYKTNKNLLNTLETTGEYDPRFLDYQTYITYTPNKRWQFEMIGNISDNHYNFYPKERETSFGTLNDVKSFKVYFDGQEKDIFRSWFGAFNITRHISSSTSVSLLTSIFYTKEEETYDIQGQYWLNDTQTDVNLGVGTYLEHARNYLSANVKNFKLILKHKTRNHQIESALAYKMEHIDEKSREYEMRDSSGYSIPHSADRLNLIYSLVSNNTLNSNRVEGYIQDTYRFSTGGENQTFYSLNMGVRFSYWDFNKETLVSPRVALAVIPSFNEDMTFRFATGLYYQAPFYKEIKDTTTINGNSIALLNNKIKSPMSIHCVGAFDYRFKIKERPYKFTAEAYVKLFSNLIPYNVNNVKITYDASKSCDGYTTGVDFKLYGEFVPGTDSWLALSLMKSQQKIDGNWIVTPTDQKYVLNLHFTDYFPGTEKWKMTLKLTYADGLPFGAPHKGIEFMEYRAPAYKRADIGLSYNAYSSKNKKSLVKNIWVGIDCLNLFGINNVNSYYWITDVTNQQYAVPNYFSGRQLNGKIQVKL